MVKRLSDIWLTDTGHRVRVQIMNAPDISQEADFMPKRIAIASKKTPVYAGSVITKGDDSFLLVDQSTLSDMRRFRALEITDKLVWKRNVTIIDPVSKMEQDQGFETLHTALPLVIEPLRTVKEGGIERSKYVIYTGAFVKKGDFLGDYEVHNVTEFLGVRQLEVY